LETSLMLSRALRWCLAPPKEGLDNVHDGQ
jgi:hypothetical protein